MAVTLSPVGGAAGQFFTDNGVPLAGGLLYTYAAGTTTPLATYTTSAANAFHANPIVLDSAGRVPSGGEIWITNGAQYKFVLKNSSGVPVATWDNIDGINSTYLNYVIQTEVQTATAGQTVFTLTSINYVPATNSLSVFVDGLNQYVNINYTETSSTVVTFTSGLTVGQKVKFTTAIPVTGAATLASAVALTNPNGTTVGTVQDIADPDGSSWIGFVQTGTGVVNRTAQAKLRETVSVLDFGAVADDSTNNSTAFNNALLNGNKTVYFPAGTYRIETPVRIYADTTIIAEPGAIIKINPVQTLPTTTYFAFINGEYNNSTYATGYAGDGNIFISGLTFDGSLCVAAAKSCNPLGLSHGENITVTNCIFLNNYRSHCIEANALKNFKCYGNVFDTMNPGPDSNREFINVDYAGAGNFQAFGQADNTPPIDYYIYNNQFKTGQVAVGSHSSGAIKHYNINVYDNTSDTMTQHFLRAKRWVNGQVSGNYSDGTGNNFLFVEDSEDLKVLTNVGLNPTYLNTGIAILIEGGQRCIFNDNDVTPSTGTYTTTDTYRIQASTVGAATGHSINTDGSSLGTSDLVQDDGVLTQINGKTLIYTGNVNSGALTMGADITCFSELMVVSGSTTSASTDGNLVADSSAGWPGDNPPFKATTVMNFRSASGVIKLTITNVTTLTVSSASNYIRYIYGVNRVKNVI